jgi:hypothetical protein
VARGAEQHFIMLGQPEPAVAGFILRPDVRLDLDDSR